MHSSIKIIILMGICGLFGAFITELSHREDMSGPVYSEPKNYKLTVTDDRVILSLFDVIKHQDCILSPSPALVHFYRGGKVVSNEILRRPDGTEAGTRTVGGAGDVINLNGFYIKYDSVGIGADSFTIVVRCRRDGVGVAADEPIGPINLPSKQKG